MFSLNVNLVRRGMKDKVEVSSLFVRVPSGHKLQTAYCYMIDKTLLKAKDLQQQLETFISIKYTEYLLNTNTTILQVLTFWYDSVCIPKHM